MDTGLTLSHQSANHGALFLFPQTLPIQPQKDVYPHPGLNMHASSDYAVRLL